jgi:hypothetical protein
MRGLGTGIGRILEPFGAKSEDEAWMSEVYPKVLKKLAKHRHFAEHGKNAELLADFYICGFYRGLNATAIRKTRARKKRQP